MLFCRPLSSEVLEKDVLLQDKKNCKKIGRIGIGAKALYLNSYLFERDLYIPIQMVRRVFKRVAMSKGGYSGKGVFASMAYLVVEYDGNKEIQLRVKHEHQVDRMLEEVKKRFPNIPLISVKAEERLKVAAEEEEKRYKKNLSPQAEESIKILRDLEERLEKNKKLYENLAKTAKTKRMASGTKPYYKYIKYLMLFGCLAGIGLGVLTYNLNFGVETSFVFFAFSAIFIFVASQVNRTGNFNKEEADREFEEAVLLMDKYMESTGLKAEGIPASYFHPYTLRRMVRIIREGRAEEVKASLLVLKDDLKGINNTVAVSEKEYEEIVTIKPMFLCMDYR